MHLSSGLWFSWHHIKTTARPDFFSLFNPISAKVMSSGFMCCVQALTGKKKKKTCFIMNAERLWRRLILINAICSADVNLLFIMLNKCLGPVLYILSTISPFVTCSKIIATKLNCREFDQVFYSLSPCSDSSLVSLPPSRSCCQWVHAVSRAPYLLTTFTFMIPIGNGIQLVWITTLRHEQSTTLAHYSSLTLFMSGKHLTVGRRHS